MKGKIFSRKQLLNFNLHTIKNLKKIKVTDLVCWIFDQNAEIVEFFSILNFAKLATKFIKFFKLLFIANFATMFQFRIAFFTYFRPP